MTTEEITGTAATVSEATSTLSGEAGNYVRDATISHSPSNC